MPYGIELMSWWRTYGFLNLKIINQKKNYKTLLTLSLWPYPRIDRNPRLGPSHSPSRLLFIVIYLVIWLTLLSKATYRERRYHPMKQLFSTEMRMLKWVELRERPKYTWHHSGWSTMITCYWVEIGLCQITLRPVFVLLQNILLYFINQHLNPYSLWDMP